MPDEPPRSRAARAAVEQALIRVVHHDERALLNAEFAPRRPPGLALGPTPQTVVTFELLTDQDDIPSEATVTFDGWDDLGAVNLRGTGYVLLHNDAGGPEAAAAAVLDRFGSEIDAFGTSLDDLRANFTTPHAQGPTASVHSSLA